MKLRSKTLVLSGAIIVAMVLILLVISQLIFLNTYSDFENRYSQHVLKDELTQLNHTISSMNQTANDWAHWMILILFVSGNNAGFINNNLPSNIFPRLHLNVIMFVDNNGKIVYGKAYNLQTNQSMNLPGNLTNLTVDNPILQHSNLEGMNGVLGLPEGSLIVISKPMLDSHEKGPIKGTLIMGRYLTPEELQSVVNIPNSSLTIGEYNNTNNPPDIVKAQNSLLYNNTIVQVLGSNSVAAYFLVRDIYGNPGTAMIIADENMLITLVNRTFKNILNKEGCEIEGKLNWIEMIVPDEREKIKVCHKIDRKKDVNSAIIPKTYEVEIMVNGDLKVFFATFEFIPGTKNSLISLIDITELKRTESLLKTSLKEKELLLRGIHHRVKNSLQIISSLLSLQASEFDDDLIIEKYKESENRIHTIALIHENLYQSTDISNIDFKNYLEILIKDIMYSYNVNRDMIKTILDIKDYKLGIETAIPLGLIINELVSNAIKHAFKHCETGEIRIVLNKQEDNYILTIKDNGIGLSEDIQPENSKSLGFMLVNALVTQLEGKISVEIKKGTSFIIMFKELEYQNRI